MKRTALALALFFALLVSMAGVLFTKVASANPLPPYEPPAITVSSPSSTRTYNVTSIPLQVKVQVFAYTYQSIERINWLSYSLDGQAVVPISLAYPREYAPGYFVYGSGALSRLSTGNHSLEILGETTYGESIYTNVSFAVDTVNPIVSILSPIAKNYTTNEIALDFAVSEQVSWIGYTLDGQGMLTITGNTTLAGLSEGSHYMIVYANDTAGNVGASKSIHFSIAKSEHPLNSETFPTTIVIASIGFAIIVGLGLLVYLKKKE